MKNLLKLLIVLLIAVGYTSCTEEFDEINTDPKAITLDKLDQSNYGFIVRKALISPEYCGSSTGSNGMQLIQSLHFDVYSNYWATTTPNFLSDRNVMVGSWQNGMFNGFYANEAAQIKYMEDFAREADLKGELGVAKVWKVYIYLRYTDLLGPIVYSQYGNMQKAVPYDKQSDVYNNFFLELDTAVALLKQNAGVTSPTISSYDPIYGGKFDNWQKMANTLRLRLGMRIRYVDPAKAKTQCEKAVADGVFLANSESGWLTTSTTFPNPYNTISSWGEYRMSADMESICKGYLDKRITARFSPAKSPDNTDDPTGVSFPYEGLLNGQTKNDRTAVDYNTLMSDHQPAYLKVGDKGPNWHVMRAPEAYFLRAEGALLGWAMGGTAQALYEEGIKLSLAENGFGDENMLGETYTTSTRVPASPGIDKNTVRPNVLTAPASTVPVKWDAAASDEVKLEQIITQKWLALFPDSEEAYAERRRTGYPKLLPRVESENPDVPREKVPYRALYYTTEYTNNRAEVDKAIGLLNAESLTPNGDKASTKLWWDKKAGN